MDPFQTRRSKRESAKIVMNGEAPRYEEHWNSYLLIPLSQAELFEYQQQKQRQEGEKIYPIAYYGHNGLYQKSRWC